MVHSFALALNSPKADSKHAEPHSDEDAPPSDPALDIPIVCFSFSDDLFLPLSLMLLHPFLIRLCG